MMWFLAPIVILGVAAFSLWVAWQRFASRFQSQFEHLTATAATNPYCARVERADPDEWEYDAARFDQLTKHLQAEGFTRIGDFETQPEGKCLRAFADAARSVYAVIGQQFSQPVTLDLFTPYADGRFVSFSDALPTAWPDPPTQPVTRCPGVPVKELLARLLRERPTDGVSATRPEQFAAIYLQARQQAMAWMIERGGPTEAEIRRQLAGFPVAAALETMVNMTRGAWQTAMSTALEDQLRDRFVAQAGAAAAKWEPTAERLAVVHDRATAVDLLCLIDEAKEAQSDDEDFDDAWEEDELETDEAGVRRIQQMLTGSTPRQVFARLNQELTPPLRLTKIGELTEPLAADIYVRPKSD
jgi:hypothetical protein